MPRVGGTEGCACQWPCGSGAKWRATPCQARRGAGGGRQTISGRLYWRSHMASRARLAWALGVGAGLIVALEAFVALPAYAVDPCCCKRGGVPSLPTECNLPCAPNQQTNCAAGTYPAIVSWQTCLETQVPDPVCAAFLDDKEVPTYYCYPVLCDFEPPPPVTEWRCEGYANGTTTVYFYNCASQSTICNNGETTSCL